VSIWSRYKLSFVGFLLMTIYLYASFTYIKQNEQQQLQEKYLETSKNIKEELETLINEKLEATLILSLSLSENDTLKELLLSKKTDKINLKKFSQKLKENSSLHNVWFQLLSKDGVSLYRSWTTKYKDNVLKARIDIAKILKTPKVISSISVGKFDITFKSIVPMFENGKLIGIIETIAKFNSISTKMKQYGIENILLVDKRYKKQLVFADKNRFLNDYYIANKHIDTHILNLVKHNLKSCLAIKQYIVKDKHLFTSYTLHDINKKPMAYFILAKELKNIDLLDILHQKLTLELVALVIFIVVGMLIYYIYVVNYKKFIEKQNQLLEINVANKTEELQEKNEMMKHQAEHDHLTQLPNRLLFLDRLKQALKHAKREKERVSVLFLDLDRFKEVNDTYGHEVGDKLLQQVTKRLIKDRRAEDTVARLGGDEFTLLLLNEDKDGIIHLVNLIMERMRKPFYINNLELYTTFSIGISSFPEDGSNHDELLRNADIAMYQAKESGKNNYHFYNLEMSKLAIERIELEKELRRAIKNDEFKPYYQPKIDAKKKKVVGLEALVRWFQPEKGLIYPDKFIPFAEEIGFIEVIDNYMLEVSMKQVLQWKKEGIECGKLSVNLSARQLSSKSYIQQLKEIIDLVGFNPADLEIEITETHIMLNPKEAMHILNNIRSLGITISIDDFGTGYSSLSYLKKLPIDKLKIDRSFIIDIPQDKDDVAIIRTIITLAKNLNLETIAEGVERKEQVDFLVKEDCNVIQGYYFSKPLSSDECKDFLQRYQLNE